MDERSTIAGQTDFDELILEGIVVTRDAAGKPNIAAMGPRVDRALKRFVLRPFRTAQTYQNLQATGTAVFHITDDCLLIAQAAIDQLPRSPLVDIEGFPCPRLADACRWYALQAEGVDESSERPAFVCHVTQQGELRPFFGFNRAKHAVLEAAILATRVGILGGKEILEQLQRLQSLIQKTAGHQERQAFDILQSYIASRVASGHPER